MMDWKGAHEYFIVNYDVWTCTIAAPCLFLSNGIYLVKLYVHPFYRFVRVASIIDTKVQLDLVDVHQEHWLWLNKVLDVSDKVGRGCCKDKHQT